MTMGKRAILLLTVLAAMLLACAGVVLAQTITPPDTTTPETTTPTTSQSEAPKKTPKKKISGSYIVVLKDDADPDQVVEKKKQEIGDLKVKHVYKNALKGFVVEIPDGEASKLRDNPEVKYVEQDQEVKATAQTLPWGINRVDADISSTVAGNGSGSVNTAVAIIDTGIQSSHPDLNVVGGKNCSTGNSYEDGNGHGTHVAGTVAARDNSAGVVGVAPGARLYAVRVLNNSGSGSWSSVICGIDWVTSNSGSIKSANMSLGGGASQAVDDAVRRSAGRGVFYALAAGNDAANACTKSPARAGAGTNNGIMTVAATDTNNREASWSNYGSCVDIWAPGVSILSTYKGGGTATMSGTSMASPHGAGGGALYRSSHTSATPSSVESALKSAAKTSGTNSKSGGAIKLENVDPF
jgi:subtilisin family serine protease